MIALLTAILLLQAPVRIAPSSDSAASYGTSSAKPLSVTCVSGCSGGSGSGITDVELRASPVQVSGSVTATVGNFPATQTVSGPATDAQLRATPLPISGTVTANAGTGTMAVSGPATDAQLRNTPLPVSGTVSVNTLPAGSATIGKVDQGAAGAAAWKTDGSAVTQPVSGTFFQATQPVSGTFWQATQPISGTVTANAGSGTMAVSGAFFQATQPVSGTFWQATQPVSGSVSVSNLPSTQPVSGTVAVTGLDSSAAARTIATTPSGAVYVYQAAPPLNPFLPRCNPVRRSNCQP